MITDILLIDVTLHEKEIKKYLYKHILNKGGTHVSYNPRFCSWYVALAGIYDCLPLLPILNFLHPSDIPPGLDCYIFPLTLITGHSSTKKRPKGTSAFQT